MAFAGGSAGKESTCNVRDLGSMPGLGRFPGEGKGYPLQYSGLENSMGCTVTLLPSSPVILLPVLSSRLVKVPWSHRPPPESHRESVLFLFSLSFHLETNLFLALLGLYCCVGSSLVIGSRGYYLLHCTGFIFFFFFFFF